MPLRSLEENRIYQREWIKRRLANETPEEKQARLAKRREWRKRTYAAQEKKVRDLRHRVFLWYRPEDNTLELGHMDAALVWDCDLVLVGEL